MVLDRRLVHAQRNADRLRHCAQYLPEGGAVTLLPPRIPKKAKRASRWRSQAHCNFVRSHACCACGSMTAIEVAHVRLGSHAGMGQKPDDWNTVSLCRDCHAEQHRIGEQTFWRGRRLDELLTAFQGSSPRSREIQDARRDRGL